LLSFRNESPPAWRASHAARRCALVTGIAP